MNTHLGEAVWMISSGLLFISIVSQKSTLPSEVGKVAIGSLIVGFVISLIAVGINMLWHL